MAFMLVQTQNCITDSLSGYPFQSLKVCFRIKMENDLLKNICKGPKPL